MLVPVFVHFSYLVFVAAFKLPEFSFVEAHKHSPFSLFDCELVEFLQFLSDFFRMYCLREFIRESFLV